MEIKTKITSKSNAKFDYKTIKTFEDACIRMNEDPRKLPDVSSFPERYKKRIIADYKLMIIYEAINNGWIPDWSNFNQLKYYPWFSVLSSGLGFSGSTYYYVNSYAFVGSRLCTDTSEKALYMGKQFESEYRDFLLFSE